ncbi:MAG: ankyrin repeat domain-containing protein [Acidobacteria bacterium]|nr:ankyrin repeat domain-containing protein [Acidobacteriota bacterium]
MKFRLLALATILAIAAFTQPAVAGQKGEPAVQEFFKAITQGDVAKVKEMLKADPQLARARDGKGTSAVLRATYYDKKEIAAVLLETGIELNIFEAAATGQTQRVRTLLKQDSALVNAYAPDGFFPLGLATFFGHRETVEVLLAAGADVNAASRESMKVTPLHSAVAARQIGIARLLIARGAKVNARQAEGGFTPLHEVAANGDLEFAKLLLEHGAEINAKTEDGKTPLAFAVSRNQSEMAAFLRQGGATL